MTYAENPPVEAWRIRIKFEGVPMIYIVSSTEPAMNDDGSVTYTVMPGYGDEVGHLPWDQHPLVTWRYLVPTVPEPVAEPEPSKPKKGKKGKAEPAPVERVVPANVMERIRAKAAEEWRTDEKARAVRVKGLIHLYWQGIDRAN